MNLRLDGKNVLVTGGSRGIGRAIVEFLADAGAKVAFTYRSRMDEAQNLENVLREKGVETMSFQSDAASLESAQKTVDEIVSRWGSIDVLVNNAGVTKDNLMLRMSEEDWDTVIDTNLKSVFNFAKAAYRPMMKQRAGKIISLSSVVGAAGNPGQTNYAASKAGIIGFSKSLAKELASRGVTVNVVAPGYVETEMTAVMPEQAKQAMLGAVPLGRPASPQDIAAAVLFLASPAADYITGQVLHINGGMYM